MCQRIYEIIYPIDIKKMSIWYWKRHRNDALTSYWKGLNNSATYIVGLVVNYGISNTIVLEIQ